MSVTQDECAFCESCGREYELDRAISKKLCNTCWMLASMNFEVKVG